jgi:hypothetical protein
MSASQPSMVAVGGYGSGLAGQTKKRAVRLARMWLLLKERPCTIVQLSRELGVFWTAIYKDVVDLQLDPLEDGMVLTMVGCGLWRVHDIRRMDP